VFLLANLEFKWGQFQQFFQLDESTFESSILHQNGLLATQLLIESGNNITKNRQSGLKFNSKNSINPS